MKRLNWLSMSLAAVMLVSTVACKKDDEKVSPVFPSEVTELTGIDANSEQEIRFDANMPWKLSSDASWCTFVQGDFKDLNDISGEAGKQIVKLFISDANQKFDSSSKANITLTMDGISKVIATIERVPMGYELTIYDAEKQPVEVLNLIYKKDLQVEVSANFKYSYSEIENVNIVRDENMFTLSVKKGFEKNAIEGMKLTIMDETGNFTKDFPVVYEGMDVNDIDITMPQGLSRWAWTVSADGKKMSQTSGVSGTNEVEGALTCKAVARNDDYDFVYMEEYDGKWYADAQWMHATHEGEDVSITFDANDSNEERNGYVIAFPRAQFESLENTIQGWVANGTDESFADDYGYNVIFQGKQSKAAGQGGAGNDCMTVKNGLTMADIPVGNVTGDYKDFFVSEFNVTEENLASITVPAGTPLTINPNMPNLANMMAFDSGLSSIDDIPLEAYMDESENMIVMTKVPDGAEGFIFLVFQGLANDGESMINEKVLLVNIGEGGDGGSGSADAVFTVKDGKTYTEISTSAITGDFLDFFMSEYSLEANQMASVTVAKGTSLVIYPDMTDLADYSVNDLNGPRTDIALEFAADSNDILYANVVCPNDATEFFFITFKNDMNVNKKLLLVNIAQ